jgi:hypothetical protein
VEKTKWLDERQERSSRQHERHKHGQAGIVQRVETISGMEFKRAMEVGLSSFEDVIRTLRFFACSLGTARLDGTHQHIQRLRATIGEIMETLVCKRFK